MYITYSRFIKREYTECPSSVFIMITDIKYIISKCMDAWRYNKTQIIVNVGNGSVKCSYECIVFFYMQVSNHIVNKLPTQNKRKNFTR